MACSFREGALHTGIVERRIQSSESGNGFVDQGLYLCFIGDVATHGNGLVSRSNKLLSS
jgi:hypothetical protein